MSPKLPTVNSTQIIRALERADFYIHHQTGSHITLKHPDGRRTVVPFHRQDLKKSTLKSILRQTGIDAETLMDLL